MALGLSALTFAPALGFGLVWDDLLLYDSPLDPSEAADWLRAFTLDLGDARLNADEGATGYYRPLAVLSFLADRALGGAAGPAFVGHAQSLFWQGAALIGLAAWLRGLKLGAGARAVALLTFALHPLQVEPVVWLSARNDLMVATFTLIALALAGSRRPLGHGAAVALAGLGFAGALSKETGLLAPLALAAAGARPRLLLGSALGVGAAVALRAGVGAGALGPSPGAIVAVLPEVAAVSARDLLWPLALHPGERLGWSPPAPRLPLVLLGLGALALALIGKGRARLGLLLAGLFWAPSLAAVSQLGLIGLRYHHLSLAGLGLSLAAAAERVLPERTTRVLAVGIGLLGAIFSVLALPHWADDAAFWRAAVARHPNAYTQTGLAHERRAAGDLDAAADALRSATSPPHISQLACFSVASVQLGRGDPAAAGAEGLRALAAGCAASPELLAPTAVGLVASGRWDEARPLLDGVQADPTGLSVVARVALEARERRRGALDGAAPRAPEALAAQAAFLLDQGGDPAGAAWLRGLGPRGD